MAKLTADNQILSGVMEEPVAHPDPCIATRVAERSDIEQAATPVEPPASDAASELRHRQADRWIASALATYSLGIVCALLTARVSVTLEDGYYYFKIAQNLASGAGSTFDGLHPTNGYHPLWLLCLVPIFWLKTSPETALALG